MFRLHYQPYRRPLRTPLTTAHGVWETREGVLVRLERAADGRVGFGEVATLEAFQTESVEEALAFLRGFPSNNARSPHLLVPASLPCLQMALWCAEQQIHDPAPPRRAFEVVGLLPAGEAAVDRMDALLDAGFRTFKWKIGVCPLEEELGLFNKLLEDLPHRGALRLDANGGLTREGYRRWLKRLTEVPQLAFLEQPLPPMLEMDIMHEAAPFAVPVALDESVCQVDSLLNALISGWNGLLVIKPSIVGAPVQYLQWQAAWQRQLVFSSAFETSIGLEQALRIAATAPDPEKVLPLGFGTQAYFEKDGLNRHPEGPELVSGNMDVNALEAIWQKAGETQ